MPTEPHHNYFTGENLSQDPIAFFHERYTMTGKV